MDISTINTIIACTATFIGGCVLFVLGAILQYVRTISRKIDTQGEKTIENTIKLQGHEKWLTELSDKVYKLNRAS